MSHFATIKTQIKDRESLLAAFKELNLEYEESNQLIEMKTNWSGNPTEMVDIIIRGRQLRCGADVGFRLDSERKAYEIVADDWELKRSVISNFRQRLVEEYSVAAAVRAGYRILSRSLAADGRLQIEVEQKVQARR